MMMMMMMTMMMMMMMMMMMFHDSDDDAFFCVSFFVGGLPHKKGVCILDIFALITLIQRYSKW